MKVVSHYVFDSCLRTIYDGYRLFLHINHSAGAWRP